MQYTSIRDSAIFCYYFDKIKQSLGHNWLLCNMQDTLYSEKGISLQHITNGPVRCHTR